MDNLTHTLIGVLASETLARTVAPDPHGLPATTRRNLWVTMAAVGSNLPDSDLLYSYLGDSKINYLLHHRGHTHTIVGALVLGAIVYAIAMWWLRRRKSNPSRRDRAWLVAILAFTPLLHICMDATNNYGVHPFWPVYDGWLYGDSVFIAEPLLWAACAPLAFLLRTVVAKIFVLVVLAVGVALAFFSGLLPAAIAIAYTAVTLVMLAVGFWSPPRVALGAGIALWLGATLTFMSAGVVARERIGEQAASLFPQAQLLDPVLTPMPANPFCWEALLVQAESNEVVLRRAMLSLVPGLIGAEGCLSRNLHLPSTAPLESVKAIDTRALRWYGEIRTPRSELSGLAAANCEVAAAMRFIRAPWLARIEGQLILGDLRYDRERALGFAEIELREAPERCPSFVPPWLPPRGDLLQ